MASPHLILQSTTPSFSKEFNVSGTQDLLDCIYDYNNVKILVYTSSTGIIYNEHTDSVSSHSVPMTQR